MRPGRLRQVRVLKVARHGREVATIWFRDELCASAQPGQFVMVFVPGYEEVPMSLSAMGPDGLASITVRAVGPTTRELVAMRPGAPLGLRGPFGRGFRPKPGVRKPLLVGAGTGAAPIMPLAERLLASGVRPVFLMAARTRGELFFLGQARELLGPDGVRVATEDGSIGFRGLATELAERLLAEGAFDALYACGREPMLVRLLEMALEAGLKDVQLSLERLVKCGMGLCGSCALGPYRVCADGPVFDLAMLTHPAVRAELGRIWRDECGRPVSPPERVS